MSLSVWVRGAMRFGALACTLMAMLATLGSGSAIADQEASRGGFTLLTAHAGVQNISPEAEVVYLLDHHRGLLMVYGLRDQGGSTEIVLLEGGHIEVLFEQGRQFRRTDP